jgi:hypothetical protein
VQPLKNFPESLDHCCWNTETCLPQGLVCVTGH